MGFAIHVFNPIESIPAGVCLTAYAGEAGDVMRTPLQELAAQVAAGAMRVQAGKTFALADIVEAHRTMEANGAGGKLVVLT